VKDTGLFAVHFMTSSADHFGTLFCARLALRIPLVSLVARRTPLLLGCAQKVCPVAVYYIESAVEDETDLPNRRDGSPSSGVEQTPGLDPAIRTLGALKTH